MYAAQANAMSILMIMGQYTSQMDSSFVCLNMSTSKETTYSESGGNFCGQD